MVTKYFFLVFVIMIAIQRLLEVKKSHRHKKKLLAMGGKEHGAGHYPYMVALHSLWLLSMPLEVFLFNRQPQLLVTVTALLFFIIGQMLRLLAMKELKGRWTTDIITLPGLSPVTTGIFRYIRHPNYVGVILEIAFIPLLHMAYLTSICFFVLNLMLLFVRIKEEEKALRKDNNYDELYVSLRKET